MQLCESSSSRTAAIAYVTSAAAHGFNAGDLLVTDASDRTIISRGTSVAELRALNQIGVRLYSVADLHAKVYVFDTAVISGSANLTVNSRHRLREAGMLSDNPAVIAAARAFVTSQAERGIPIDDDFLRRAETLELSPPEAGDPAEPALYKASQLYRLEFVSKELCQVRPYMIALIELQLGGLRAGLPFHLWPKINTDHDKGSKPSLLKRGDGRWELKEDGVDKFTRARKPHEDNITQFKQALVTGEPDHLPNNVERRGLIALQA